MKKLFIACDFDGTITRHDTLHLIVARYGDPGLWQAVEPRLRAGEITLEQAMQEEFAGARATRLRGRSSRRAAHSCSSWNDFSSATRKSCRSGTCSQSALRPQKSPPL